MKMLLLCKSHRQLSNGANSASNEVCMQKLWVVKVWSNQGKWGFHVAPLEGDTWHDDVSHDHTSDVAFDMERYKYRWSNHIMTSGKQVAQLCDDTRH
jgi:hypothetical protein